MDIPESASTDGRGVRHLQREAHPLITVDEMDEICNTDIGEFTLSDLFDPAGQAFVRLYCFMAGSGDHSDIRIAD